MIELLIAASVVIIFSTIAVSRYGNFAAAQRATAAAHRVAADLSRAQKSARLSSQSRTVTFRVGSNAYEMKELKDMNRSGASGVVMLGDEPYRATLKGVDFKGGAEVVFNGYGSPGSDGTVTVESGGVTRVVRVNAETGRVSVE